MCGAGPDGVSMFGGGGVERGGAAICGGGGAGRGGAAMWGGGGAAMCGAGRGGAAMWGGGGAAMCGAGRGGAATCGGGGPGFFCACEDALVVSASKTAIRSDATARTMTCQVPVSETTRA